MSGMNSGHVRWLTDHSAVADSGSEVRTQLNKVNLILSETVFGNEDTAAIFIDVSFRRRASLSLSRAFPSLCPVFLFSALLQTLYRLSHKSR